MQLDAPTLFTIMIVVTSIVALLLLWAWLQNRSVQALAWWGVAYVFGALGSALIPPRGLIPDWLSIDLANAFLIVAYGLMWMGVRIFYGRRVRPSFLLGTVVWLGACQYGGFYASFPARASLSALLVGIYSLLGAWEFWRGKEPLASRSAAVLCLALHGLISLSRIPPMTLGPAPEGARPLDGFWFAFIAFEAIVFSIAAAFLLLAMAKERVELRYKVASRVDPLTGVFNRRAFVSTAERMMTRAGRDRCAVALILFDLDHFKKINDAHGHAFGDDVLKLFCLIASSHLRPNDVLGRLGGEEFAVVLPATGVADARKAAARISAAFTAAGQSLENGGPPKTVSSGIAVCEPGAASFTDLLAAADRGLYKAKRLGRNRVEDELVVPSAAKTSPFAPSMQAG